MEATTQTETSTPGAGIPPRVCRCDGTGWIQARNGGMARCPCKQPKPPEESKPESNGVQLPAQAGLDFALAGAEEFAKLRTENPQVIEILRQAALALVDEGHKRGSMQGLLNTHVRSRGIKVNDHLAPYISRTLMKEEPRLRGFFEMRSLGAKRRK